MRLIEGVWDCKYCDTKGIQGSIRECPNCGNPRGKDTKFYIGSENSYVPEEKATKINRRPDWLCQYCGSLNSDDDKICKSCGAERTSENLNYFEMRRNQEEQQYEESQAQSYEKNLYEDISKSDYTFVSDTSTDAKSKANGFVSFFREHYPYIGIGFLIIIVIVGIVALFIPREKDITVQEILWERSIEIERYQTVNDEGWDLPPGASAISSENRFSDTEVVIDECETKTRTIPKETVVDYEDVVVDYIDLGNGYFEEITSKKEITETYYETEVYTELITHYESVYETWYYYETDKWLYERSINTRGKDKLVYWGDLDLEPDERESSRNEKYYVTALLENGKTQTIVFSYEDWNSMEVGETVRVKVSAIGYGEVVK